MQSLFSTTLLFCPFGCLIFKYSRLCSSVFFLSYESGIVFILKIGILLRVRELIYEDIYDYCLMECVKLIQETGTGIFMMEVDKRPLLHLETVGGVTRVWR